MSDPPIPDGGIEGVPDPEDVPTLRARVAENPRPALAWLAGAAIIVAVQVGSLLTTLFGLGASIWSTVLSGGGPFSGLQRTARSVPTLLDRGVIPNEGHRLPEGGFTGTFLGLEPMWAWFLRLTLVIVYGAVCLGWMWYGYLTFRRHYRAADWTPTDDIVDVLRSHRWGQFGFLVVALFVLMALFAPAVSPATAEQNIRDPYSSESFFEYYDEESGTVQEISAGAANRGSVSQGNRDRNVGPMTYDDYGRFHPFGTLPSGKDMFTFLAFGARISLFIGVASMVFAGLLAMLFAMVSSYYKGLTDLALVVSSDSIQALPVLMVLILASVVFSDTWLAQIYNGALLFIAIFTLIFWPYLWRAVRGPAFQVSEEEWIDAAKSYGQHPVAIMRKHMAPYIFGYMMVYASLSLGGVIISVAGLTFLGLGITPPTPEWGRAISVGQPHVASPSWHISLIPGFLITLVVTAFNALGDGIRDAIDPQSSASESQGAAAGGGA